MKWIAWCSLLVLVSACQDDAKPAAPQPDPAAKTTIIQLPKAELTEAYRTDITTLCDVVRLSGAADKPAGDRWPIIAMWLGPHLVTPAAHEFLVAIQPLTGEPKALALEIEAKRVGLERCELAAEWR